MTVFPAGFLFSAGLLLLGFAIHPAMLEIVHNALREFSEMVFGDYPGSTSEEPLSRLDRLALAGIGAILVFLSGGAIV